jgi:aspartate/methionine/tyrosine aminotransferase
VTSPNHHVSQTIANVELSAIKEMAMRGAKVTDAASLTWGVPSFRTPQHIRDAAIAALEGDEDVGKYALPNGLPELRELVVRVHRDKTGVDADAERNVLITAGNMQGMNSTLRALLEPGDEVIVTDPGFASHIQQIRMCGGVPVPWPLDEDHGWRLQTDLVEDLVTPRTRAVVLVTPSNPTGAIFSKADLQRLGGIVQKRQLVLLIDDPYSEIIYESSGSFFNLAKEVGLADRLVYMFTFSKIHAMSGWRLGYMIVPDWLRQEVLKVHDATLICAPRISQAAGMAALRGSDDHIREFRAVLARRRALICERLNRVDHVFSYIKPEGAYYVFPRILVEHESSRAFAIRLLYDARVTVTPGSAFGPSGEHHVRMAYCVEDDVINKAFDRIERYFAA